MRCYCFSKIGQTVFQLNCCPAETNAPVRMNTNALSYCSSITGWLVRPKKGLRFLAIFLHFFSLFLFCILPRGYFSVMWRGDQISQIQSMVAKRGLTKSGKRLYPYVKKSFKTQHSRILGCNWTSLHSPPKKKIKNIDGRVLGNTRGDQKPEAFVLPVRIHLEAVLPTQWIMALIDKYWTSSRPIGLYFTICEIYCESNKYYFYILLWE